MLHTDTQTEAAIRELARPYARGGFDRPEEYVLRMIISAHVLRRLEIILEPELLQHIAQDNDSLLDFYIQFSKANHGDSGFEIIPSDQAGKVAGIITPDGMIKAISQ